MPKRRLTATIALVVAASIGFAAPVSAHNRGDDHRGDGKQHNRDDDRRHRDYDRRGHKHHHHHDDDPPGTIKIVADNLNNPRQITIHEGAIYVAEAGTGGDICPPDAEGTCLGFTGSVTRVKHGRAERIQTGLLSAGGPEGEVVGLEALAFKGDKLHGVMAGTCSIDPATLPEEISGQLGKVLRLRGGTEVSAVADPQAFECSENPDGQDVDSNPYGLAIRGKSIFVADAAGNDIVKFRKHRDPKAYVLSTTTQPVPTSLAWGPGGDLYIGTLNFEGGPGGASVYRLDTRTGELSVYATGLTAITALAFGRHGRLYVSEWTTGFGPEGPMPGDVVSIPWGGGLEGRKVIGGGGALNFPTGVAVANGDVYVSNWGIATGEDGPFGPGNHGQLVKISQ